MMFAGLDSSARYSGWPADAVHLVEHACARHGGWNRYDEVCEISARLVELGGPLPLAKGIGRTFPSPRVVRVAPHAGRTTFVDWPAPPSEGRFERGDVSLVDPGAPAVESRAHRARMPWSRWQPLDALYFFGYALANYWALPFLLGGTRFVGVSGRRIVVDFPAGFDTHSPRQAFEFDDAGLLHRHDYTAVVVGAWATGSHFTTDYAEVDGLWFARTRHVNARLGAWVTPIPVLHARLDDFSVR